MGRRRKLTRRQRALCWCLALALVAGLGGLQYRYLSYWGPIREAEGLGGIGKTAWLMDVPPDSGTHGVQRMLRGNERALMVMTIDSHGFPFGWSNSKLAYLDCTDARAFHAAVYIPWIDEQVLDVEFFGRVEDPAGDKVRMELFWTPDAQTELEEAQVLKTVEVPKLDWVKREGLTCFERRVSVQYSDFCGRVVARFTLLDWEGKELESWIQDETGELIGSDRYF